MTRLYWTASCECGSRLARARCITSYINGLRLYNCQNLHSPFQCAVYRIISQLHVFNSEYAGFMPRGRGGSRAEGPLRGRRRAPLRALTTSRGAAFRATTFADYNLHGSQFVATNIDVSRCPVALFNSRANEDT